MPTARVAVVGSGIAGLSAAYHIAKHGTVEVTLFEKNDVLGGHEMTHDTKYGQVDLGYMVMNFECYPNLTRFYREHMIPLERTDMGFSVQSTQFQWSFSNSLSTAARLLVKADFWSFVFAKSQFHKDALEFLKLKAPPTMTLKQFCVNNKYHAAFVDGWLKPFCEAVWSSPTSAALEMEAYAILCFLRNHGFLQWKLLQWYTPKGRTTLTLERFSELFTELGVSVRLNTAVESVKRNATEQVELKLANGETDKFDKVVLATPSGTAIKLLAAPDATDQNALGGFHSCNSKIVLHTDPELMPIERKDWVSWNVIESEQLTDRSVLTYWVPQLQHQPTEHLFITLNPPPNTPAKESIIHERWAAHPAISIQSIRCQKVVRAEYQGHRGVWHAGAWLHYGFHECGFRSGIEVARSLLGNDSIPLFPVEQTRLHLAFEGNTVHTRYDESGNVLHGFRYLIKYDYVNVDAGFQAWWGGLFRADHFGDPQDSLSEAVRKEVAEKTGTWPTGAIDAVTTLREFGAVFNPIAVFLCWDTPERNKVDFVVSEVTNTPWGQRVVQVLPMSEAVPGPRNGTVVIERRKELHVSPFNPVPDGRAKWRYTLALPNQDIKSLYLKVELLAHSASPHPKVVATMDLTNVGTPRTWIRGPVPTSWITLYRIHAQAMVLMLSKKMKYIGNTTQARQYKHGENPPFIPNDADFFNGEFWIRAALIVLVAVMLVVARLL